MQEVIDLLDEKICWECAETNPVYAHNICADLARAIKLLEEVA